ncbi:armadillo-type protein [Cantharellus anzutake]|uniref:armadillo-type protein n=1 Tax=Cantharellus anzutake TaxID=1750568 RepID=UPI001903097C|nr:armadillo-type protein [Cantharellus anzutake]KAF8328538.1 armadillo-type protein [Cantharellus anzutake]
MDSDAVRSSILPKLDRWLEIITSSWTWSPDVLNSIHILCKDVNHKSTIQQDVLFSRLRPCIMSHHAFRRIRALHLLFYNANLKNDSTSNSVSPSSLLLQSMIAADDSVLEVSAVRERIFRTTNVGATIRDDAEVSDVQLAGMWLLAQLKVNLQPLWKPTVESFASLMERFPETLWQLSFSVLKLVGESVEGQDPSLDPVPVWSEYFKDQGIIRESIFRDDQNTWTDSSAHRLVGVGRRWRQQLSQGYGEYDRLDLENFETQILAIFAQASTIAKKHSYELSPYSLSVMRSGTTSHRRLKAYLSMIAKLPNPRTLHSSSELYSFYFSIVAAPNHYLQSVALDCILAHRPPAISPYGERLRNVIDETKWRDELLSFKLDRHIEPEHRAEFVHLLICLLYRRLVEKRARHSKGKRPVAAYGMLNTCTSAELRTLVNLMLQPFPMRMDSSFIDAFEFQGLGDTNLHKQSAFLDLLSDVHKYLGAHMTDHWPVLLGTTLEIINNAERLLSVGTSAADVAEEEEEEEPEAALDDDQLIETETQGSSGLLRSVRQKGLRCFNSFFVLTNGQFDFLPYMGSAFQSFIIPRIRAIGENSRVPILLIDVLLTFSKSPLTSRFLVDYDADLLPTVFQSLDHPDTKPMEIMKVLDLAQAVVEHAVSNPRFAEDALLPNVTYLMERLTHLAARRSSSSSIVERQFGILSSLSPFIQDPSQAERLFRLILSMLWKSLPETRQLSLIQIMETLVQFVPDCQNMSSRLGNDAFQCISRLFQSSCERTTRDALVAVFRQLCGGDSSLETTAKLVDALNSYLNTKDIPDFERRLNAFSTINEDAYRSLSHTAWLPILYNMLFFVEDRHEFSIRINAGLTLRRFIDRTSAENNPFTPTFRSIIYPSLCRTIRCKTENARMEALKVIGHAVEKLSGIPFLKELQPLIGDTGRDSFFHNLYHSQKQPRIRAIRKLITQGGNIRATTISALLLPLLSHFLDVNADRDVQDMSVVAFGSLSRNLAWDPYLGLIETRLKDARLCNARKRGAAKIHLRTVNAVIDNFPFTLDGVTDEGEDEDADGEGNAEEGNVEKDEDHTQKSQPDLRIADAITGRLLPALFRFMDKRDPKDKTPFFVATSIVRMCNKLPETTRQTHAARLITILSQALRTKIEPIRVFVRATLCRISTMLGNSMLPVLFRELRHALVRGSHLHVLAHVTHTLLFHVTSREHAQSFGSLDAATEAVAHIAFEVVFGQSAERSESEGLRAAYREVLGAVPMGVQLFGIMAQQISSSKIRPLLEPIRALLHETESGKILQKIDEILGRIASGLNANKYLTPTDILSLCHTLLTQNAQFLRGNVVNPPSEKKKSDVDVQLTRHVAVVKDLYSINSHKFVALGLNLFNAATNRFDIKDLDICSRLDPLVVAISPTLHSPHNVVLLPSLRASATILRFPLPSVSDHLQAYVQQILLICRKDGSTESEVVQMALRTIASVMRDCPESVFEEADISFILELIAPDLEELDREDAIFTILRAIVSRKFVAHEIYDIMDKIAERMVTSQSQHSRSICRKLTLQFVLDYPHGTNRLKNTMTSLAKNLSYTFESGRISTLELLLSLFSVIQLSLLCEYAELFFLALVMLLANDDSSKCREKGAMVMKVLLQRLDETILKSVAVHLQKWVQKTAQPSLVRTAAQIYGIIAGAPRVMRTIGGADFIVDDLNGLLRLDVSEMDVSGLEWQVPYQALTSLNNLVQPKRTPNEPQSVPPHIDDIRWNKVTDHLLFPHAWVRLASARLLGSLFSVSPIGFPDPSLPSSHPSSREGSVDIAKKLCLQLRSHHLDDKLGLQIVKNLFYLGRCFTHWPEAQRQDPATDTQDSQVPGELTKEDDLKRVVYPLPWLFSKLSFQARRALDRKRSGKDPSEHHMSSILKWFAAMVDFMSPDDVEKYLNDILSPLYLVMRTGARNERMVELQNLSEELQDMLQAKVGTTKFTRIRNSVRQGLPKKFGAGRKATVVCVIPTPIS